MSLESVLRTWNSPDKKILLRISELIILLLRYFLLPILFINFAENKTIYYGMRKQKQ